MEWATSAEGVQDQGTEELYGCETWSLTWSEQHRLKEFKIRVLRKIVGPKTDEVTGE